MLNVILDGKTIKDIELFVFDKDGTLIDLYNYWYHMIQLRAEGLCSFYNLSLAEHKNNLMFEMGVDTQKGRLRPEGPVGLLPRQIVQKAAEDYLVKLNCQDVSGVCFRVFKEVDEVSLSLLGSFVKPLKGAVELLRKLKMHKAKVAIATTDKTERARLAVETLRIGDLVDFIVGADKVNCSKPAPDMLRLILTESGTSAANSVMVGDAETDVQMGINAGFKASIGVCSGLAGRSVLSKLTPYVVGDVSGIGIEV